MTHFGEACMVVFAVTCALGSSAKSDQPTIPDDLKPFQGKWVVRSIHVGLQGGELPDPIKIEVIGQKFFIRTANDPFYRDEGLDFGICGEVEPTCYGSLKERGGSELGELANIENQIAVFWFIGLYRFVDGDLELVLKYCGQGLEGEHFRKFRPPSGFEHRDDEDQIHMVLGREMPLKSRQSN